MSSLKMHPIVFAWSNMMVVMEPVLQLFHYSKHLLQLKDDSQLNHRQLTQ